MQNSCDILIKNSLVVLPTIGVTETNIMIENGKIKKLVKSLQNISYDKEINANNKYVIPGVIDPHVHYGVYTSIDKASLTESRSAAIGGVTTMFRMLRLDKSYRSNIQEQLNASKNVHYVDYSIHPSILKKIHLDDLEYLCNIIGLNSFKIYLNLGHKLNHIHMDLDPNETLHKSGFVNIDDQFLDKIVETISRYNSTLLVHAEDPEMCYNHIKREQDNEKINSNPDTYNMLKKWSDCRPYASEVNSIKKIADLARTYACSIYFVHIGSNAAIDAIIKEREKGGCNLYVETCPHYLTHSYDYNNLKGKVVPPLRSKEDVSSIWNALRNGMIDTVGTDHVANNLKLKIHNNDLWKSLAGFPGLATLLPVLLSEGVNKGRINIQKLSEITSYNASRIFDLYPKKGTLLEGSDADLVIIDLNMEKKVDPDLLQSFSDYSIYDEWTLKGWPILTMVRGKVIMQDFTIDKNYLGHGEFLSHINNKM
ncbi:MAG: dihydroorotase [Nitrososphaeraceae archaeon]